MLQGTLFEAFHKQNHFIYYSIAQYKHVRISACFFMVFESTESPNSLLNLNSVKDARIVQHQFHQNLDGDSSYQSALLF